MVKIGTVDPLSFLERTDKWFLGGGKGSIYAPPFPRWLEAPGFWDECYFADIRLTRLYTVLFCDSQGQFIQFRGELLSWRPDRMIFEHRSPAHVVREVRLVTEGHQWVSTFELVSGPCPLQAFLWALPELKEPGHGTPWQSLTACEVGEESISYQFATAWPTELEADRTGVEEQRIASAESGGDLGMLLPLVLQVDLQANQPRLSHTVNLAQRHDDSPLWQTSLLPQKLRDGRLPGDNKVFVGPPPVEGLVHILQQYELKNEEPLVVSCQVSLADHRKPNQPIGFSIVEENEKAWRKYFASVPQFSSSDPYLTNAYWYRWYGLRLNTADIPHLPICRQTPPNAQHQTPAFSPFVTEGIGFFRNFVTYSAQAHLREAVWMHSPKLALGILENLKKCQRADGSYPGHNYSCRPPRDFYHADFGTGVGYLQKVHGLAVEGSVRNSLARYLNYLIDQRGHAFDIPNGRFKEVVPAEHYRPPMMIQVFDQNETGQEYMSRYLFVASNADQWASFRVCGVEATEYAMRLAQRLLQDTDDRDDKRGLKTLWDQLFDGLCFMSFDEESSFFCDVLLDGKRSAARPATGLYPLAGEAYPMVLERDRELEKTYERWCVNKEEFWLPKGFPATALSDPTFSAEGEWKEKRLNCPWNGRSWPMTNSHLIDSFANWVRDTPTSDEQEKERLRTLAGEALKKAITLMFHEDDPQRPNSYEHYDPIVGTPSLYRGYDDYMHSWIVDLIIRHAVGVRPGENEVTPLPLGVDWIECTDIPHPKGRMDVRIEGVWVFSVVVSGAGVWG